MTRLLPQVDNAAIVKRDEGNPFLHQRALGIAQGWVRQIENTFEFSSSGEFMMSRRFSRFVPASISLVALLAFTLAGAALPAQAQTYTKLYDVPGGSGISNPDSMAVAQGRDGDMYATSPYGGTDYGTLFKFTPSGTVSIVNDSPIGYFVVSGVTLGTDGNLYGTDQDGGPSGGGCGFAGCGQIYKVTPAGAETVLYNFTNTAGDGYDPQSAPIQATNGKFYGTTPYSAGNYISVAYSITSAGAFSTVHTFANSEGQNVYAGFVQGSDGNLYGVAQTQGANGFGTIFKMTTAGVVTVLHSFDAVDGENPYYPLIQASDGNFYGVANGGTGDGAGVIFKITPSGTYTVLHNFVMATEGGNPSSSLVQATDGKLYGVTPSWGPLNGGTIYSITTSGTFSVLYSFDGTDVTNGYEPSSPLKQNTNGKLYGETYYGGTATVCNIFGCGVIYSLDMGLKAFVSLESTSGKEGVKVNILGQGFTSTSVVKFGGTTATAVTRSGSTFLTATVPAAALTASVTVATGKTTLTSSQTFKVTPTQTTFAPPSGPVGTSVTITGTGLLQTSKVTFNKVSATFTVVSDTEVTATVPTGATTGKVALTTKGGSATSTTSFTVN
jgi:uncharacterized repeat protein (TIGR03803 family)